jgi:membrane associated rhomboid family serine protease
MGIYNRDYFRNDQRSWRQGWLGSGYKYLIAANVVVFVCQLLLPPVTRLFDLAPEAVIEGQVWRFLTYAFCHDPHNPLHILFNMLFLAWFGATLERMYGTREFILFYLVAAVASGLAFFALALALGDPSPAIGASGAVMAVVVLYAIHFPRDEVYLLGLIRVQIRFLVLFYVVFDLWPVLGALGGEGRSDGVAHAAHLGGLAFGFVYQRFGLRLDRVLDGFKRLRAPRIRSPKRPQSVRLYDPSAERSDSFSERGENLDVKVDAILEKIQAHGEASLTEQERDVLRMASQRYKENPRHR